MTATLFVSLVTFSFAMSITPGPNNLLLATSGLTYGFRRTVPAMSGTLFGMALLFGVTGAGLGALIVADPRIEKILRIVGAGYLAYLAWRLWSAGELADAQRRPPLRVWHAAAFQFVNPKAWMMAVSAVAIYVASAEDFGTRLLFVVTTFLTVATPCIMCWTAFGAGLRAALKAPSRRLMFNRLMAALTLLSAALVLFWN